MRHTLIASSIVVLCTAAEAQPQTDDWTAPDPVQILTECGRSDGYAYYFQGGLILLTKVDGRRTASMADG
jgi:hypothetical protein